MGLELSPAIVEDYTQKRCTIQQFDYKGRSSIVEIYVGSFLLLLIKRSFCLPRKLLACLDVQ